MNRKTAFICAGCAGAALLIGLILHAGVSIHPEEDSVITVYGDKPAPVPGVKATMFGSDISDQIIISDATDPSHVGTYPIRYQYRFLGIPLKTVTIDSVIADMDAPEIELEEGAICFSKVGKDWSYPAYLVHDNYDPAENLQITLEGDADPSKRGTYPAQLKACDTSGNCAMRSLRVVVGDAAEEDFLPERFDLDKLDRDHYLLAPNAEPADDTTFRELYWIGDSNILNLGEYGGLPADRVVARYAMGPATFDLPIHYGNVQQSYSAADLVSWTKPKRVILMMGEAEAGSGDPIKLAEEYGKCLDELKKVSPDTKIYVSAILPIRKGSTEAAATQEQINRVNYCLLQMCREKKIPMLCADSWLKDESGYGIPDYYLEDGFHLQAKDFPAYTDYVRYCLD